MATVQAQADIEQNEFFGTNCQWIQYPPDSVRRLVQVRINANPGLCRNDVVNGARLYLRKDDDASPLFCTVVGSIVDANGRTHYTLTDEYGNAHTSRLRIKDTVDPLHRAYSIINNMTERQACRALFEIMERLWEYRAEHMRVSNLSNARYRIAFRFRVHAVIAFNRIHVLRLQSGRPGLRKDGHMQCNAHLLDIMHWFYRTYTLYNQRLAGRSAQSYIQRTQDAMIQFVLATIALRMGYGPYKKFTLEDGKINDVVQNPEFREGRAFPKAFLSFITQEFCDSYTEAFKGYYTSTLACNVKTTRTTLLNKKKRAIYSNDLGDNELDRVTSSSVHMYYAHYRICDLLWFGFEKHYFHNAKNVLGIPSRPNDFNPNDRMPLLSDDDLDDMILNTEQLYNVFPNKENQQRNPWV